MPLYWLLAAYAAGSALAVLQPLDVSWPIAAFLAGGLGLAWGLLRRSPYAWLPLLLGTAFGAYLAALQAIGPPRASDHVVRFATGEPLTLEARIVTAEANASGGHRLLVEALGVVIERQFVRANGRLRVTVGEGALAAAPGQVMRARCRIRKPLRFGTPGEFDYPLHLAAQGIHATAFIKQAEDLAVPRLHPATRAPFWETLRLSIARRIETVVAGDLAGPVKALTIGMRGSVSPEHRQVLSEGGVAHLFAISGLHFGLFGLLLYTAGSWLYRRSAALTLWMPPRRLLPTLLIGPMAGYLLLTGNAWSTARAFVMTAVLAILLLSQRRTPPLALLALAALGLLIINPLALFQPGFQLSFAGLAGILVWSPAWQTRTGGLPVFCRWPLTLLLTTGAATLATAPFVLWHFHIFAPASLPANLLAIPLIAWGAVPAGLAGALLSSVATPLADLALQVCAAIITLAFAWVDLVLALPGMQAIRYPLTATEMLCLCSLLGGLLAHGRDKPARMLRITLVAGAFLVALFGSQTQTDSLRVTALSVGQGDATLLSFPGDRHFLIDGGGMPGSTFDPGERLIAPALGRLGIRQLQGVILTHDHPDHRDGLAYILTHLPVRHFWSALAPDLLHQDLRSALTRQGTHRKTSVQRLPEGWTELLAEGPLRLTLFTPGQAARDLNDRSLVVLAEDRHNTVLLTADLGPAGLDQLLSAGVPGPVGLLKIPHHGSRHSMPERFLDELRAATAFVSAGANNAYGFPHPAVIEACDQRNIPLYRTDREGTLVFTSRADGWQVETYAKANDVD